MKDSSNSGGVGVAIGLILILTLLIGGGFYWAAERQQLMAAARQAEQAREAEAQARLQAERDRAVADAAAAGPVAAEAPESSTNEKHGIRVAVEAVLHAQEEAWNRGDIDAFAEHYWKSDDVTFSSGGKTTRGWMETLNGYRERYPTRERMGRVTFSNLEITPLGDAAALVLGEWKLERESEPLAGNFTLVFRKIDGRWVIIHDHTSRRID
jgi:beta-aspartyl-peptidase (threonine type)